MPSRRFLVALLLTLLPLAGGPAAAPIVRAEEPGVALPVRQAYDFLLDRYVAPLDHRELLQAAWQGVRQALAQRGVADLTPLALELDGDRLQDWERFAQAYAAARRDHAAAAPAAELEGAAIRAMTALLAEGHTQLLDQADYQTYLTTLGRPAPLADLGVRLRGPEPTIVELFPGGPAERGGLRPGDVIRAVDGAPLDGADLDAAITALRGPADSPVELTVVRPGWAEPLVVTLARAVVPVPVVSQRLLAGGVGYLRLRSFAAPVAVERFDAALDDLYRQGARALVLDLRGNAGGRLDVGVALLSRFVTRDPLLHLIARDGQTRTLLPQSGQPLVTLPLAVLVDEGTSSMAEVLAAVLQERGRARLVGVPTAGRVSAAQVFPLADGTALQVAVRQVRTGGGQALDRRGVAPDWTVPLPTEDLAAGRDPQLAAALAALAGPSSPAPAPPGGGAGERG